MTMSLSQVKAYFSVGQSYQSENGFPARENGYTSTETTRQTMKHENEQSYL